MTSDAQALAGKRILIVDDEELVREVTVMMVEEAGAATIVARDGAEAVEVFALQHKNLAAVFMDFSMPHLNGFQAFERMQEISKTVPIILVSGLKITPEVEAVRAGGRLTFLNKPFKQDDVIKALKRAIFSE